MRALTKKKPDVGRDSENTTIKIRKESMQILAMLSGNLFFQYQAGHRKANVRGPSARVALDYVLLKAAKLGILEMSDKQQENNIFRKIAALQEAEE